MTKLDEFYAQAKTLPDGLKAELEEDLSRLSDIYFADSELQDMTADDLAELKRRVSNPKRKIATPAQVKEIFGHSFNG